MFLNGVGLAEQGTIPHCLFMCFQGTFAIITAALISGAIVERMRFSAYVVFISCGRSWSIARSATGCGAAAGWPTWARSTSPAAPSSTSMPAPRRSWRRSASGSGRTTRRGLLPHNVPFTLLGAGLLWFGWFGFNAGSALAANGIAALAFTTTMLAPAGTLVVWTLLDMVAAAEADRGRRRDGHRRRPRGDHAGGRVRRADERDRARRDRRGSQLLRADLSAPRRSSTTRSTSSRRTALAGRSAPSSPASSRRRA